MATLPSNSRFLKLFLCSFLEQIGSGNFAEICKGLWTCDSDSMVVAVKSLKEIASEGDRIWFLQEAAIMGQFWHPNVTSLYGVITVGEPVSNSG